ncbi:hypothetical protein CEV31_2706 [Brucella thiophenivorans]|uniref:Uncharacterized protein n=1 Tax=Brucella thiophenivorans TaxID=571255 RepID=A0A256FM19_9HYPH|nr:hypothetical protein CEV31_2706 [Brucella thiophenivorans]
MSPIADKQHHPPELPALFLLKHHVSNQSAFRSVKTDQRSNCLF